MIRYGLILLFAMLLSGCGKSTSAPTTPAPDIPENAVQISIIYAPESEQYMPEIITRFNEAYKQGDTPIFITGTPPQGGLSSGGVMQGIVNAALGANVDNALMPTMFAPSVSHWLSLANLQSGRNLFDLDTAQPTAISPVVIAIWESRLNAIKQTLAAQQNVSPDEIEVGWEELLGVLNSPNGWQDYGIENGRRAVYYGHADPTNSSTALSTLIAEFYACAREDGYTDRRMELSWVEDAEVQACVRDIEQLVKHYARRTEDFLEFIGQGPDYLDFVAVEEIDILCLNTGGQQGDETCNQPAEPLVALYPKEGTFWHEHPIGIVNASWVTPEQQAAAQVFIDFVLMPEQQELIMSYGFRPANPDVPLAYPFVEENGVTPEGPSNIIAVPAPEVLTALQDSWSLVRKQADIILLFDVSGSMEDDNKLEQAKAAAQVFLDNIESNNRVALYVFSEEVHEVVPLDRFEINQSVIRAAITDLEPLYGTELYLAVETVTEAANLLEDESRIRAVILLSDGEDTGESGTTLNDALAAINASHNSVNPVIVIPLAYGSNADTRTLMSIARNSATQMIFGDPANITEVLRVLSSYF